MIELTSDALRLVVDPARGAVISSIVATDPGVELLYEAHWPPAPLETASRDEVAWTKAWQGGWNVLFPNAGASCSFEGRDHPFHGEASITPWTVVEAGADAARVRWSDGELVVDRLVGVDGASVSVTSTVSNAGGSRRWYLLVEHVILGAELLGASTVVAAEATRLVPLADEGPPLPGTPRPWPEAVRARSVEDWSVRPSPPASRCGALDHVRDRTVVVQAPAAGLETRISWSEAFPSLWFWEEREGYDTEPWEARTVCLGLEPATASTGEGLAAAVERAEAPSLAPGEEATYRVELEVRS